MKRAMRMARAVRMAAARNRELLAALGAAVVMAAAMLWQAVGHPAMASIGLGLAGAVLGVLARQAADGRRERERRARCRAVADLMVERARKNGKRRSI